jgi:hypothetical protein
MSVSFKDIIYLSSHFLVAVILRETKTVDDRR